MPGSRRRGVVWDSIRRPISHGWATPFGTVCCCTAKRHRCYRLVLPSDALEGLILEEIVGGNPFSGCRSNGLFHARATRLKVDSPTLSQPGRIVTALDEHLWRNAPVGPLANLIGRT